MPHRALGRQDHHPNHTPRAAIPLNGLLQRASDKVDAFTFRHTFSPVGVTVAVNVRRSRTTNSIGLLVERAS